MNHKDNCHKKLLRMFQEHTITPDFPMGRTTIRPSRREPSPRELSGYQRSRVRRFEFMPRDL